MPQRFPSQRPIAENRCAATAASLQIWRFNRVSRSADPHLDRRGGFAREKGPAPLSLSVPLSLISFQTVTGFHEPRVVDVRMGDRLVHAASAISRSLTSGVARRQTRMMRR
jgi:hypothetical protein